MSERWSLMDPGCLDLPAWPVHTSHHAFHCVPPQDRDAQVLDGLLVRSDLVASARSLLVKSVVQRSPQTGAGDNNEPSGFACLRRICFVRTVVRPLFAQERGKGVLFQGVVFSVAHGQCGRQRVALKQKCCGKNDGYDGLSHGEDLQAKPW